jgi:hypothetical protein
MDFNENTSLFWRKSLPSAALPTFCQTWQIPLIFANVWQPLEWELSAVWVFGVDAVAFAGKSFLQRGNNVSFAHQWLAW